MSIEEKVNSWVLAHFPCLVQYCKPQITPWEPYKVPLVMLEVLLRSKVVTLQEKVELLDRHRRLRSAAVVVLDFKINEFSVRTMV